MSKLSQFKNWYAKYLTACDKCYDDSVEKDYKKTEELAEKLDKLVQIRTTQTDMYQMSPLDNKIEILKKEIKELYERIDKIDQIKKEMKERLKMNSGKIVYKRILAHPFIKEIVATETSLRIITKKLYVDKKYIGYYQITLESNGMHCVARNTKVKNLEYLVHNKYDHWHVEYQGPCLGAWKDILQRHLDTYQLFLFFDTFIHYLTMSSSAHAYIDFEKWFEEFTEKKVNTQAKKKDQHNTPVYVPLSNVATYATGTASTITPWGSWIQ